MFSVRRFRTQPRSLVDKSEFGRFERERKKREKKRKKQRERPSSCLFDSDTLLLWTLSELRRKFCSFRSTNVTYSSSLHPILLPSVSHPLSHSLSLSLSLFLSLTEIVRARCTVALHSRVTKPLDELSSMISIGCNDTRQREEARSLPEGESEIVVAKRGGDRRASRARDHRQKKKRKKKRGGKRGATLVRYPNVGGSNAERMHGTIAPNQGENVSRQFVVSRSFRTDRPTEQARTKEVEARQRK